MESRLPLIPRLLERVISRWADKRLKHSTRHVAINRHNLYILPTRHGVMFFMILLLILLGVINYENSPGYMLAFLLGSLGLLAMIYTHQNLNRIELRIIPAEPVFAGQTAFFPVTITQPAHSVRPALQLQLEGQPEIPVHLIEQTEITIRLPLNTESRGWIKAPRLKIYTEYPLGLFHAWSWLRLDAQCLVYPAPDAHHHAHQNQQYSQRGEHIDDTPGVDDFAGIRQYQAGDQPSHLAWKAIAKTGALQTKLYSNESSSNVTIDWFQLDSRLHPEKRLSILCRMVLDADHQGLSYSFNIPGTVLKSASGLQHKQHCLKALALFEVAE